MDSREKLSKAVAQSLATLAATLGLAATAQAAWSPPFQIAAERSAGSTVLAANPARQDSIVAWLEGPGRSVRARRIAGDGTLGPIRVLGRSADLAEGPWAALDRSGVAVVVWYEGDAATTLKARRLDPRGKLGPALTVAPSSAIGNYPFLEARLAQDVSGDATIVWPRVIVEPGEPKGFTIVSATIHARTLSASGRLRPIVDLPGGGAENTAPRVAAGPSGRATISWLRRQGAAGWGIHATTLDRGGTLGPVRDVTPPQHRPSSDYELAVDRFGNGALAWVASNPDGQTVAARRMTAAGALGPLHTLSPRGSYYWPQVLTDAAGRTTVGWRNAGSSPGFTNLVQARRIDAGETLGPLWNLSPPSKETSGPGLAVDATGAVTAAWTESLPLTPADAEADADAFYKYTARTRRIAPDGSLGPIATLVPATTSSILRSAQVAATAGGVLVAAWDRSGRDGSAVEAARLVARCAVVRPRRLRASVLERRDGRRRAGIAVALDLDRAADVRVGRAILAYRSPGGQRRIATLRLRGASTGTVRQRLNFYLSASLRRGQPVRVTVRMRTRPYATGCRYGAARTLSVATTVR